MSGVDASRVEAARSVIAKHAEHMRGYTLPSLTLMGGYMHALYLLERDAGFMAADVLAAVQPVPAETTDAEIDRLHGPGAAAAIDAAFADGSIFAESSRAPVHEGGRGLTDEEMELHALWLRALADGAVDVDDMFDWVGVARRLFATIDRLVDRPPAPAAVLELDHAIHETPVSGCPQCAAPAVPADALVERVREILPTLDAPLANGIAGYKIEGWHALVYRTRDALYAALAPLVTGSSE